jgi:hypothetical protein
MGRDRTQLLACALISIGLIIMGTLAIEWYTNGPQIRVGLAAARACNAGHCARVPRDLLGPYGTIAPFTLFTTLATAIFVAVQTAWRLVAGYAVRSASRVGIGVALVALAFTLVTGFVIGPADALDTVRSGAPMLVIAGLALAIAALALASSTTAEATAEPEPEPVAAPKLVVPRPDSEPPRPLAVTRTPARRGLPVTTPPNKRIAPLPTPLPDPTPPETLPDDKPLAIIARPPARISPSDKLPALETPAATPRTISPVPQLGPSRTTTPRSGPLPVLPPHLRGKLNYVCVTVDLTNGGVDARREDGTQLLVLWDDVVGVVARRMPDAFDAIAFIDLVSTAGATLRMVPWTKVSGEAMVPQEGQARARALLAHITTQCPYATLDPATQKFAEGGEPAQLPDLSLLQAHDERLA